jgi:hypothetical protein
MMVTAAGLGLIFVPMSLVALARVPNADAGIASSLLNTGQQIGGSIGLAVLGTVAWSAVASSLRSAASAASAASHAPAAHLTPAAAKAAQTAVANHALAYGFSRGYLVSAAVALLALIITLVTIRIKRDELAGINPMAAPTD